MFLFDTNILSASAPTKAVARPDLADWIEREHERVFLSVVTVAEIEEGIAKSLRQGAARKAARLAEWLDAVLHLYAARILQVDLETARGIGMLADRARGAGQAPGFPDLAIAATAMRHGLTILTRNLRHFTPLGVAVVDPFLALPKDKGAGG